MADDFDDFIADLDDNTLHNSALSLSRWRLWRWGIWQIAWQAQRQRPGGEIVCCVCDMYQHCTIKSLISTAQFAVRVGKSMSVKILSRDHSLLRYSPGWIYTWFQILHTCLIHNAENFEGKSTTVYKISLINWCIVVSHKDFKDCKFGTGN